MRNNFDVLLFTCHLESKRVILFVGIDGCAARAFGQTSAFGAWVSGLNQHAGVNLLTRLPPPLPHSFFPSLFSPSPGLFFACVLPTAYLCRVVNISCVLVSVQNKQTREFHDMLLTVSSCGRGICDHQNACNLPCTYHVHIMYM